MRGRARKKAKRFEKETKHFKHAQSGHSSHSSRKTLVGKVQKNPRGFAFIIPKDPKQDDAYVSPHEARILLNGDIVEYTLHREGRRFSAEIKKIIERGQTKVFGKVKGDFRGNLFETPEGEIYQIDSHSKVKYEWAIGEITALPTSKAPATVFIKETLGKELSPSQDYLIAIQQFNLNEHFSERAVQYAENTRKLCEKEFQNPHSLRKDLRHLNFVTIDGEDAKDFDDAIFVQKTEQGAFILYVAIADVSFFVRPNSPLDLEAKNRATSVYFPGFCLPMLPEILSNDLCSLRPKEDKLSVTAEIHFDRMGNILNTDFYESIIKTKARLTYNQVHAFLEGREALPELKTSLQDAFALYKALDKKRHERGVLDFDLGETKMELDKSGMPIQVYKAPRFESHKLIEEFMIAANSVVAKALRHNQGKALFRIHEIPEMEKIEEINQLSKSLGFTIMMKESSPKAFSEVLAASHGKKGAKVLHQAVLRAQKQARYEPDPKGHFGLALRDYAHFTSPIRRYPDLVVHRALKKFILKRKDADNKEEDLEALGELTSDRERRAMEAERFVTRRKECWFLQPFQGETFLGSISGVTEKGIFVEISNYHIEGFLPIDSMPGFYQFDEKHLSFRKRPGHTTLTIGDPIQVQIELVSVNEGEITLGPAEE